jgi:propionyl-CoA carboxylase alpha chain
MGDAHGNLVHCFERECSIQRRHQKVIEEAPSPAVSEDLRARMGAAAVAAGQAIGYTSAGTVEFLVDGDDFWFLEVNTRLQVEHPITEEITGLDLVREQLKVAEGVPLGFAQDDLSINGHAIEVRLYAEDPARNFLPSPGTVEFWAPSTAATARFDSGIESGTVIGTAFDPMLAKVIVHAENRREAALRLARVMETTRIQGLTTNRDFLVAALRTPEFLAGDTTTDFIERVAPAAVREVSELELHQAMISVVLEAQARRRAAARVLASLPSGWRNSHMPPQSVRFRGAEDPVEVTYVCNRDGTFSVNIGDSAYQVQPRRMGEGRVEADVDGQRVSADLDERENNWYVHTSGGDLVLEVLPRFTLPGADEFQGGLTAPMPGKVLETHVQAGAVVEKGQLLLILEAMKMEHRITAPVAGTVTAVHASSGDQVANGELLIMLEEAG